MTTKMILIPIDRLKALEKISTDTFHLSHSLIGDIMSSFRTKLCCSIFQYFCVIIQTLDNGG